MEDKKRARVVAIVGSDNVGMSDKLAKLLATHKFPIVITKEHPQKPLSMCIIEDGNMAMLTKAVNESRPMTRAERRKLEKSLQKSVVNNNTSKV